MSYEFFSIREVCAAKPHRCEQCGREISKGEKHTYAAGKFDGDFYSYREHFECRTAWLEVSQFALEYDDHAPFLRDADDLREWKPLLIEKHPVVAERLWPTPPAPLSMQEGA